MFEKVADDARFNTYGVPRNKTKSTKKASDKKETVPNANYLWIGYFATALNENGKAALVMANSASDAGGSELEIRKKIHLTDGDLPPVLDIEHKPADKSVEDFQRDVLTWLHIVEDKYHAKPIIYTYYKFKEKYLSAPVFDDYPYWIAHYYVDKVQYKGKWKFWQHTDAGKLPGIKGYVDFNIYNGSYYDLRKLCIGSKGESIFGDDEYDEEDEEE